MQRLPVDDRAPIPSAELLPEAQQAQISEARTLLRADARAAGSNPELINEVLNAAVARFADAHVHAFIGILVEREVRERQHLQRRLRT